MNKKFTEVSLFFFGYISKIFESRLSNLKKVLISSGINENPINYLSNCLFLSFIFFVFFEFFAIFIMNGIGIYFEAISFLVTIIISLAFTTLFFLIIYKYPYYVLVTKKQKIEQEIQNSIRHLSVLKDKNMTVKDVLIILQTLEYNDLLTKESKKVLFVSDLNKNLKGTLELVASKTCSEIESIFFRKLIRVLDKKESIQSVIDNFLKDLEQKIKEESDQRQSKTSILFGVNLFLFLMVFILLAGLFFISKDGVLMKQVLLIIGIIFPIIEVILIIILK